MDASQIGKRAWSYAGVLQQAGLSCVEYVEQLTMLLFLKMADQLAEPPYSQKPIVPKELDWKSLLWLQMAMVVRTCSFTARAFRAWYGNIIHRVTFTKRSFPRPTQRGSPKALSARDARHCKRRVRAKTLNTKARRTQSLNRLSILSDLSSSVFQIREKFLVAIRHGTPDNLRMGHDVFISYATEDRAVAGLMCRVIEATGTKCWMAPRDILGGVPYPEAIVKAIDASRAFVLVFSAAADESPQVLREVERAVSKKVPLLPFRVQNHEPTESMAYFIGVTHWLDAFEGDLTTHLEKLIQSLAIQVEKTSRPPDLASSLTTIDAALGKIEMEMAKADAAPLSLARIATVIDLALSFGVPIYNAGSQVGCAEVYLRTARGLVAVLSKQAARAAPADVTPSRLAVAGDDLKRAADAPNGVTPANANELAWALRRAFDRTLLAELFERAIAHVDGVIANAARRSDPFRFSDLCEALQTAIGYGNVLYRARDFAGIVELHAHTTRRLLTAIADRPVDNGDRDRSRLAAARMELAPFANTDGHSSGKQSERIARDVYEAFLRVLKMSDG